MSLAFLAAVLQTAASPEPLKEFLEHTRAKAGLPSICAGAILDGKIVAVEAVGVRRLGSDERVATDDPYHCGSITKSFTAALFATYVQEGRLSWDAPLPTLLPNLAKGMDPAYRAVTPLHLMAHRSGLGGASWPKDPPALFATWNGTGPSPRADYVRLLLAPSPSHPVGTEYEYSNANYVTLAAIVERAGKEGWESLLRQRVLDPLGLRSAGYGPVGAEGQTKGPWGHAWKEGKWTPVPPSPGADNAEILGPAGTLHMSVPDLLRWCAFQADEGRSGGLLTPTSFAVLHHAPFGGEYAGGLIAAYRPWAGGFCFNHGGSNTLNDENMWILPAKRFGVVVATNAMGPGVQDAVEAVTEEVIRRYCPK